MPHFEDDPRDHEWWARKSHLERTCAHCGEVFDCDERLIRLPAVLCPQCSDELIELVDDALEQRRAR